MRRLINIFALLLAVVLFSSAALAAKPWSCKGKQALKHPESCYTVVKGDMLRLLALRWWGKESYWPYIAVANNIDVRHPRFLIKGEVIIKPVKPTAPFKRQKKAYSQRHKAIKTPSSVIPTKLQSAPMLLPSAQPKLSAEPKPPVQPAPPQPATPSISRAEEAPSLPGEPVEIVSSTPETQTSLQGEPAPTEKGIIPYLEKELLRTFPNVPVLQAAPTAPTLIPVPYPFGDPAREIQISDNMNLGFRLLVPISKEQQELPLPAGESWFLEVYIHSHDGNSWKQDDKYVNTSVNVENGYLDAYVILPDVTNWYWITVKGHIGPSPDAKTKLWVNMQSRCANLDSKNEATYQILVNLGMGKFMPVS